METQNNNYRNKDITVALKPGICVHVEKYAK